MALVKLPTPVPSVVLLAKTIVGVVVVLQQTPVAVIVAPPSLEIVPPELAVVLVMALTAVVVRVGTMGNVLNVI